MVGDSDCDPRDDSVTAALVFHGKKNTDKLMYRESPLRDVLKGVSAYADVSGDVGVTLSLVNGKITAVVNVMPGMPVVHDEEGKKMGEIAMGSTSVGHDR